MASGLFVWPECTLSEYHYMCVTIPHSVLSAEKREEDEARQSEYVGVITCTYIASVVYGHPQVK